MKSYLIVISNDDRETSLSNLTCHDTIHTVLPLLIAVTSLVKEAVSSADDVVTGYKGAATS